MSEVKPLTPSEIEVLRASVDHDCGPPEWNRCNWFEAKAHQHTRRWLATLDEFVVMSVERIGESA